jgi:hypothetical protein
MDDIEHGVTELPFEAYPSSQQTSTRKSRRVVYWGTFLAVLFVVAQAIWILDSPRVSRRRHSEHRMMQSSGP